jgi:hypothetical protein
VLRHITGRHFGFCDWVLGQCRHAIHQGKQLQVLDSAVEDLLCGDSKGEAMMRLEIHLQSVLVGAVFGSILTGATVIALGKMYGNAPASYEILVKSLEKCDDTEPIYIQQAGGLLNVKCNGHREDRVQK